MTIALKGMKTIFLIEPLRYKNPKTEKAAKQSISPTIFEPVILNVVVYITEVIIMMTKVLSILFSLVR